MTSNRSRYARVHLSAAPMAVLTAALALGDRKSVV